MTFYIIVLRRAGSDDYKVVSARSTIDALLENEGWSSARVLFK